MLNTGDSLHPYQITKDNASDHIQSFMDLQQSLLNITDYPDLSDTAILFFGDSIIGNYTGSTSIPGVVEGLTGSTVFNMGYGGNSAAMTPDISISLPGIIKAFFDNDFSNIPTDRQVYLGLLSWRQNPHPDKNLVYVINYGLNDYFEGLPIASDDSFDITTYTGALRTAIQLIREKSPKSQILLCTPTYSARPSVVAGVQLESYVNACIQVAKEMDITIVDNYHDLEINEGNYNTYLPDMTHPNPQARFMMAQNILSHIKE